MEELTEVNRRFTESLNDVIEIATDEGDEDLSTVKIGKLFLEASQPMLGAFKSYCTRQVKPTVLLHIFLSVSDHFLTSHKFDHFN